MRIRLYVARASWNNLLGLTHPTATPVVLEVRALRLCGVHLPEWPRILTDRQIKRHYWLFLETRPVVEKTSQHAERKPKHRIDSSTGDDEECLQLPRRSIGDFRKLHRRADQVRQYD